MAQQVTIDKNGNVTADGVTITPEDIAKATPWIDKTWREVSNKANWNLKGVERGVAWLAGIAAATNGFGQIAMPNGVRAAVTGCAAIILAAIHVSTPKAQ